MSEEKSEKINKFIQVNSPDGGFLQSEEWISFQRNVGNKTYNISSKNFWANIIRYKLPIVGSYFYAPRGPVFEGNKKVIGEKFKELVGLAGKENSGWIRMDVSNKKDLNLITELIHELNFKIKKSPHDMQPKQIFKIDISKNEEELLAEMKSKTRYNIRLAAKKGVVVKEGDKYIEDFLRLVKLTSKKQGITPHPENYYRKMLSVPSVELRVAEFGGKIIVANLVSFYGETVTYLHGASDSNYRNVMAPFLLQWRTILNAKEKGFKYYDFGGVKTDSEDISWEGITRFKLSFSKDENPLDFLGSYDIVISPLKYGTYRILQTIKSTLKQ